MYAFGPIPRQKRTGRVIGTHQKIDRVARRLLFQYLNTPTDFPGIKDILHFEGSRGPDGIKLKSPGKDEPWHFIDPSSIKKNDLLLNAIDDHITNLANALSSKNTIRAAFEAAWLAHAVTDGLTPAHHEPLAEQLESLKSDGSHHKVSSKIIMSGNGSKKQFIKNNWSYWGAKGLMTNHTLFEAGVATTVKPLQFNDVTISDKEIEALKKEGFRAHYISMIQDVAALDMYDKFKREGWTRRLATQTRKQLLPTIIRAVLLAWLEAYHQAGVKK